MNKKTVYNSADVVVVGGGLVGSAIAFGMADRGARVIVLDEGDRAHRAARGNTGLVWYQCKGLGMPRYQQWCLEATELWPKFAERIYRQTGIDVSYRKTGGFVFSYSQEEFEKGYQRIEQIRKEAAPKSYNCRMLDRQTVQDMIPEIKLGAQVTGASYSPHDGHLNPLALLSAMHKGFISAGGGYFPGHPVFDVHRRGNMFVAQTPAGSFSAPKIVIAAGNGTGRLAKMIDLDIPVRPLKGQQLITERTRPLLHIPSHQVRQTTEGGFQLGFSEEEMGFDTRVTSEVIHTVANIAVKTFPILANLQVVHSWAALRVMTPDGMPIYQASESYPGAFAIALHSGVTLTVLHATKVARWILEDVEPEGFENFTSRRFDFQKTA